MSLSEQTGTASMSNNDVVATSELWHRPKRLPDFESENRALLSLVKAMSESPSGVFQKLVTCALELCRAGSAGISVCESHEGADFVRWRATAGSFSKYVGKSFPLECSPCGAALGQNSPALMQDPARIFSCFQNLSPAVGEILFVPFAEGPTSTGLIWVIAHDDDTHFDSEDVRVLTSLTGIATNAIASLDHARAAETSVAQLRESEEYFRTLFNSMDAGFCIVEVLFSLQGSASDYRFLQMNPAFVKHSGLTNAIGRTMRELAPEHEEFWYDTYGLVATTGEPVRFTSESKALGRWFDVYAFRIDDSAKRRVAILFSDVTERKRSEALLRASEEQRRLALDAGELGAWNIDPNTKTLTSDSRFRLIFNGSTDPISYEEAFARIHADDRERIRRDVEAAIQPENPAPYEAEYRVVRLDGTVRWVYAKGRASFGGIGSERRLTSFDGTVVDITDRKNMENELRRIAAELSDADHRKNEFLAMLAHELRNPLAPIRNALMVIQHSRGNLQAVQTATDIMNRQVDHMVRLVDDLLDVSRITSGKIELRMEPIDIATVIRQAIESSRPLALAARHDVTLQLPNLPVIVNADAVRLAQVFGNLLNNACKYSEPGGKIHVTANQQGDYVLVSVKDTGVGIEAPMLPKIFELFTQIDQSLERSQGGLGIGLSLVKSLIELHGGTVTALSEGLGHGSEFIVRLPIAVTDAALDDSHDPDVVASLQSIRILVVDDNRDSASTLEMLLRLQKNETRLAYDGEEAIAIAEEFRPDVLLLDIGLPKLNGYEVARRIRTMPWGRQMILVALTGWGQEEDRRKSKDAGFDGHIVKPVDHIELKALLTELMARRN